VGHKEVKEELCELGPYYLPLLEQVYFVELDFEQLCCDYDNVVEYVKEITRSRMADVVLNSIGVKTWDNSFACVGINGRWVTFGGLTGPDVKLNVQALYRRQIKLIGSTGGTRRELHELIENSKELKVRVWKKFKLENIKEALEALFAKDRDGRILLEIT
jgi:NADPH:quinone reductase-like Zn-dependent oxidoreductase